MDDLEKRPPADRPAHDGRPGEQDDDGSNDVEAEAAGPKAPSDDDPAETEYSEESRLIYGKAVSERWNFERHVIPPLSMSTNFRFASAAEGSRAFTTFARRAEGADVGRFDYVYDRLDEPNKDLLEEHVAIAERGDAALVFSTGMAAISTAVSALIAPGREIVAHVPVYGCTYDLLTRHLQERLGIATRFVDLTDLTALDAAVDARTALVYVEAPSNPSLNIVDLAALARRVETINRSRPEDRRVYTIVDNTFASPFCQRPLELGVDVVVESLTKHIGGFGTVMGGAVCTRRSLRREMGAMMQLRKDTGSSLSASSAWNVLVYGLSTLPLRMRRCQDTASRLATFLEGHPAVAAVRYPGLPSHPQHAVALRQMRCYQGEFAPGSMIYIVLDGDGNESREAARRFCDFIAGHAYVVTLAVSLGQIRTLVESPAAMTHAGIPEDVRRALGIDPGGVRISVGIEPFEDIRTDIARALDDVLAPRGRQPA